MVHRNERWMYTHRELGSNWRSSYTIPCSGLRHLKAQGCWSVLLGPQNSAEDESVFGHAFVSAPFLFRTRQTINKKQHR